SAAATELTRRIRWIRSIRRRTRTRIGRRRGALCDDETAAARGTSSPRRLIIGSQRRRRRVQQARTADGDRSLGNPLDDAHGGTRRHEDAIGLIGRDRARKKQYEKHHEYSSGEYSPAA